MAVFKEDVMIYSRMIKSFNLNKMIFIVKKPKIDEDLAAESIEANAVENQREIDNVNDVTVKSKSVKEKKKKRKSVLRKVLKSI